MSTNNAHKKFVNKIIEFNKYVPEDAPAMTKKQREEVVGKWTEGEDKTKIIKRTNDKKRRIKKAKAARRKFIGRIAALGLSAIAAFTVGKNVYNGYTNYQEQNSPRTLEMALEQGETPHSLGIDSDTILEIEDIEEILEKEHLTNQEIIALAPRINSAYFDTVKGKLANTLGIEREKIKIYTQPAEEGTTMESVEVKNGSTYINKDPFRNQNSIPREISDSIKNIAEMQDIMQEIQQGNFNRDYIIEKYRNKVKSISQIAAMKFNVDEKGNISADVTKVKDFHNKIHQTKTATLDQEKDIEER